MIKRLLNKYKIDSTKKRRHNVNKLLSWDMFNNYSMPSFVRGRYDVALGTKIYVFGMKRKLSIKEKYFIYKFYEPHANLEETDVCEYCDVSKEDMSKYGYYPCPQAPWRTDPDILEFILTHEDEV